MNIFIACPERVETGGIELLHQLCYELDTYENINAYIWNPFGNTMIIPLNYQEEYKNKTGKPQENDIVIFPEIWANYANNDKYKNIIYWESVDNAPKNVTFRTDTLHIAQSYYALDYLENGLKIPESKILYITDYLNNKFFEEYEKTQRYPIVLYNPAKGLNFTKEIIEKMPDVNFIALSGMSKELLINTMRRAMLYIDFGHHPGKDRIPREAAICGCCIIVGRSGSANYYHDVNIPEEYKFEKSSMQLPMICNKIYKILNDYNKYNPDFCVYRWEIKREKEEFKHNVYSLVKRLQYL